MNYPEPGKTYIPDLKPAPEPPDIDYVKQHGNIVMYRRDLYGKPIAGTVEVKKDNCVYFVPCMLDVDGKILSYAPFEKNTYVRAERVEPNEFGVCRCGCHTTPGLLHIAPCCEQCPLCGQNISDMQLHRNH